MRTALRLVRAMAWLRWRTLVGSVRGGRRRDGLERVSRMAAIAVPALLGALVLLTAVFATGTSFLGGRALAGGDEQAQLVTLTVVRILLAAAMFAVLLAPLLDASRGAGTSLERLALLPVPRWLLHVGEILAAATDPWMLVVVGPLCVGMPAGLAWGGAWGGMLLAVVAGVVAWLALACLGAAVALGFALVLRDRKRGETARLVVLLLVTVGGFTPILMEQARHGSEAARQEERPDRVSASLQLPPWAAGLPSELYASALQAGTSGRAGAAALSLAGLAAWAAGMHALSSLAHARLLATPASSGVRKRGVLPRAWTPRLPLLSPAASAVALAEARLVLRTVRGKMAIFATPLVMVVAMTLLTRLREQALPLGWSPRDGVSVALVAVPACLLALEPATMNVFAIDRAGLTLQLLQPAGARELLRGKAAGGVLLSLLAALISTALAAALSPVGAVASWLCVLPLAASASFLLAPAGALLSLLFPRRADLGQVGSEGNAHPAASVLGTVALAFAWAPGGVLMLVGRLFLGGPWVSLALVLAWLPVAFVIASVLLRACEDLLESRRENLALVAQGR